MPSKGGKKQGKLHGEAMLFSVTAWAERTPQE